MLGAALRSSGDLLLELGHFVQLMLVNITSQFLKQVEMLRRISLTLLELREVPNYSLHILNGRELRLTLLVIQELLHELMYGVSDLTKVREHDVFEEFVVVAAEHDLFHLFGQA